MSIVLFQAPTSSASWRLRIALAYKQLEYETVWIDLHKDEHLAEDYLRSNPTHQVPCLDIDGQKIIQTVAMIEYLEEQYPNPPLMPKSSFGKATVRGLTQVINSTIQPMHNLAIRRKLTQQFSATQEDTHVWCRTWLEERLLGFETLLQETAGRYCVGDSVTMVDIYLYPQMMKAANFGVSNEPLPHITKVMEGLKKLPAFQGSHVRGFKKL